MLARLKVMVLSDFTISLSLVMFNVCLLIGKLQVPQVIVASLGINMT